MCCRPTSRALYLSVAMLWLILTIVRQVLDSIGKLWIPIAVNSFQIFSCICGLLAALQWRLQLLILVMLLNFASTLYNIALVLWYNEYLNISRDEPLLSAGLPYSYSFFLRYTPFCKSYFNLTTSQWLQAPCSLPYYQVESAQALLHIFMAFLSITLSTALLRHPNFHKKCNTTAMQNNKIRLSTDHPVGIANHHNGHRQEYLNNSIYKSCDRETEKPSNSHENYIQHSAQKPARKSCQHAAVSHISTENLPEQFSVKNCYSMSDLAEERREMKLLRCRSIEANCNGSEEIINSSYPPKPAIATNTVRNVYRAGSLKSFKMPTTEGVRRILSREEIFGIRDFQTNDSTMDRHSTSSNLKSLVSFDPKSNVLIRVQNHVDDDTDDDNAYQVGNTQRRRQQEQQKQRFFGQTQSISVLGRNTPPDSGHPSSSSTSSYPPNEHGTNFIGVNGARYYDPALSSQRQIDYTPISSRKEPLRYHRYGVVATNTGPRGSDREELRKLPGVSAGHPESEIRSSDYQHSSLPVINSNSLLV